MESAIKYAVLPRDRDLGRTKDVFPDPFSSSNRSGVPTDRFLEIPFRRFGYLAFLMHPPTGARTGRFGSSSGLGPPLLVKGGLVVAPNASLPILMNGLKDAVWEPSRLVIQVTSHGIMAEPTLPIIRERRNPVCRHRELSTHCPEELLRTARALRTDRTRHGARIHHHQERSARYAGRDTSIVTGDRPHDRRCV